MHGHRNLKLNLKSLFVSKLLLHNTCRFKSHPALTCYFNIGLIIHLFIDTQKNSVEKHFICIQNDCCTFRWHSNKYRGKDASSIQKITLHLGMHSCQNQKIDCCALVWHHIHTGEELKRCNNTDNSDLGLLGYNTMYPGCRKSVVRQARKQANVSVRMACIFFKTLPCRKTWWQFESRCCWNCARPWRASELVSFLVGAKDLSTTRQSYRWTTMFQWHMQSCYLGTKTRKVVA